ncbi:hypothetical protein ACA910_004460 [Epithemia clementina (nom. ined.)]
MSEAAGFGGRSGGGQLEERVDCSVETNAKLPQAQQLAQAGQLSEALALLSALEKKCRVHNDTASLVRVCESSLQLCHDHEPDDDTNETLIATLQTLSTRRSQKTAAIKALIHTALPWCVQVPYTPVPVTSHSSEQQKRDKLVVALLEITEGKIFLERERAQLTRALATIKEEAGDVAAAADTLQDVHVETFGSLSKREKVEFILEQLRLTLAKQDYVRAHIVAGKISRKQLHEENMEEYKIQFYTLLTLYHRRHAKDAFELAKDYHAIYSTPIPNSSSSSAAAATTTTKTTTTTAKMETEEPAVAAAPKVVQTEETIIQAFQATIVFVALSPYGNEQQDMMHRIQVDPNLEKVPASFKSVIDLFLKQEIIQYPMPRQYEELEQIPEFIQDDLGPTVWHDLLHRRIIQHNIRVVSKYYKQIRLDRLAQLLQLDAGRVEQEVSSMVSDGGIYAKMDRPQRIIRFLAPKSPEQVLSEWALDIEKVLHLVETTSHLINKENMTAQKSL